MATARGRMAAVRTTGCLPVLGMLERIDEPVIALDEGWRIAGLNSAAARLLGGGAGLLGTPCHTALRALDVWTGLPCASGCPGPLLGAGRWIQERRLQVQRMPSPDGQFQSLHVRCLFGSTASTLVFLSPLRGEPSIERATALPALLEVSDPCEAARLALQAALARVGADRGEAVIAGALPGGPKLKVAVGEGLAEAGPTQDGQADSGADGVEDLWGLMRRYRGPVVQLRNSIHPARWAISVPVQTPERLSGGMMLSGPADRLSVGRALRDLSRLACELGLFLRWAPGCAHGLSPGQRRRASLKLTTLGGLSISVDGLEVGPERFERRQSLDLLKWLAAAENHTLTREEARETFWPDTPVQVAMVRLRVVLHGLRKALEPDLARGAESSFLDANSQRVALRRDTVAVDADEFLAAYARCIEMSRLGMKAEAVRAGRQAMDLYRGPFMLGEDCSGWCSRSREKFHEVFLDTSRRVRALLEEAGRWQAAAEAYPWTVLAGPPGKDSRPGLRA